VAKARGVRRAQVALAWLRRNPVVVAPIVGATKQSHLRDAVASLEIELTENEVAALEAPYTPRHDFQGISDDAELARISVRLGIKAADDSDASPSRLLKWLFSIGRVAFYSRNAGFFKTERWLFDAVYPTWRLDVGTPRSLAVYEAESRGRISLLAWLLYERLHRNRRTARCSR
jgi:hypothetical protein